MPVVVRLPTGEVISVADLPKPDVYWTIRRKWIVAQAVRFALIERDEAKRRYWLSDEELDMWIEAAREGDARRLLTRSSRVRGTS